MAATIKVKIKSCSLKRELDSGSKIFTIHTEAGTHYEAFEEFQPGEEVNVTVKHKDGYPAEIKRPRSYGSRGGVGAQRPPGGLSPAQAVNAKALELAVAFGGHILSASSSDPLALATTAQKMDSKKILQVAEAFLKFIKETK